MRHGDSRARRLRGHCSTRSRITEQDFTDSGRRSPGTPTRWGVSVDKSLRRLDAHGGPALHGPLGGLRGARGPETAERRAARLLWLSSSEAARTVLLAFAILHDERASFWSALFTLGILCVLVALAVHEQAFQWKHLAGAAQRTAIACLATGNDESLRRQGSTVAEPFRRRTTFDFAGRLPNLAARSRIVQAFPLTGAGLEHVRPPRSFCRTAIREPCPPRTTILSRSPLIAVSLLVPAVTADLASSCSRPAANSAPNESESLQYWDSRASGHAELSRHPAILRRVRCSGSGDAAPSAVLCAMASGSRTTIRVPDSTHAIGPARNTKAALQSRARPFVRRISACRNSGMMRLTPSRLNVFFKRGGNS